MCRRRPPGGPPLARILEHIQRIVPFDAASLYLKNDASARFEEIASVECSVPLPEYLAVAETPPAADSPSFPSLLYVPLTVEDAIIGLLALASNHLGIFSDQHLKLTNIVADQLAVSLERQRYINLIEERNRELRQAQDELRANQEKIVAAERLAVVARLAASINHQINNPLAVIVGHVQCLALEHPDFAGKTLERLERIEMAAQRIAAVNRQLLKIDASVAKCCLNFTDASVADCPEAATNTEEVYHGTSDVTR